MYVFTLFYFNLYFYLIHLIFLLINCCFVSYDANISTFLTSNPEKASEPGLNPLISLIEMKKLGPKHRAAYQNYISIYCQVLPQIP